MIMIMMMMIVVIICMHKIYVDCYITGMLSWLTTYPFDVIKSNIQIEMGGGGAESDRSKLSTIGMGKHLLKTHGPVSFLRHSQN